MYQFPGQKSEHWILVAILELEDLDLSFDHSINKKIFNSQKNKLKIKNKMFYKSGQTICEQATLIKTLKIRIYIISEIYIWPYCNNKIH